MRAPLPAVLVLTALLAACSSPASSPTTSVADAARDRPPATARPTTTGGDVTGTVTVTIGDRTLEFAVESCTIADDVLNVTAGGEAGALTIRHASPPTRQPPEPSFGVFRIEGATRYEAPPAAVQLDVYDPATGVATGDALDVVVDGDSSVTLIASFSVECSSDT